MSTTTDEEGLVRALLADPWDGLARSAYGDWLEENGRPLHAELVRSPPNNRRLGDTPAGDALRAGCPAVRLSVYQRGGIPSVRIGMAAFRTKAFQRDGPAWMRANHITGLELEGHTKDWSMVASSPVLACVRHLDLGSCRLDEDGPEVVFSSLPPTTLSLDLDGAWVGQEGMTALWRTKALAGLAALHFSVQWWDGMDDFRHAPFAGSLRHLDIGYTGLGHAGAVSLFNSALAPPLVTLSLNYCGVTNATAKGIASTSALASLRNLDLSNNDIGEPGLAALARSPLLPRLRRLWLGGHRQAVAGRYLAFARALADVPGPVLILNSHEPDTRNPALRDMLGERLVLEN
jgi:uncharacterized protein (TIGR02996 family)